MMSLFPVAVEKLPSFAGVKFVSPYVSGFARGAGGCWSPSHLIGAVTTGDGAIVRETLCTATVSWTDVDGVGTDGARIVGGTDVVAVVMRLTVTGTTRTTSRCRCATGARCR